MAELQLVDARLHPYLSGRFEPVHREVEHHDLKVTGDLPREMAGAYLRNGPDPKHTPLGSYSYPMEGDGMLHGLWFEDGTVRYKNRWVMTNGLRAEDAAGRALYGGVMTPAFVDRALLGPDPDPGWPSKLDAFINIVRHGGRYLALEEGTPPYEVTAALETVGRHDFGGGLVGMTAHPKIDPATGEMVVFRYDIEAPFLTWAIVAADGSVTRPETAVEGIDEGYMIHDFAVTEEHLVLCVNPAVLDLEAMFAGGPLLSWKPELGSRIAVIRRDGRGATRWIEHEAFWVWHFANAHAEGDRIVMDFPMWQAPGFLTPGQANSSRYVRAELDPTAGTIDLQTVHEAVCDFPRVDDRLVGRPTRHTVLTASSGRAELTPGEHDVLCRVDLDTGAWHELPLEGAVGEPVFVPRPGGTDELDGWYLAYVASFAGRHSTLGIWDADAFPGPPRAEVRLPQRVPNGLHGNWFAAD